MSLYLDDGDVRLHHGDVRAVLAELPDASVDCVVTSPPYWQLRDYAGMATWEGGDPGCDHAEPRGPSPLNAGFNERSGNSPGARKQEEARAMLYRGTCARCGAVRHDHQIGLEPTIEEYVAALVAVFAQVRRVLAPWGTCWLNLGDSYASSVETGRNDARQNRPTPGGRGGSFDGGTRTPVQRLGSGLKPKDLCMVPARVALALQANGWWLRSRVIWAKPNPMPESVTDRPTSAHEEIFLLTKAPTYYYDADAVREAHQDAQGTERFATSGGNVNGYQPDNQGWAGGGGMTMRPGPRTYHPAGRNLRNVWSIATEPTPEAHFATFPLELVRRCLAAGCPERVCRECGEPSRRVVEREADNRVPYRTVGAGAWADGSGRNDGTGNARKVLREDGTGGDLATARITTTGWTDCGHDAWRPGIVLDPFIGSGKTAQQARRMGLHAVGIDGSAEYLEIAAKRLQQQSLFAQEVGPGATSPPGAVPTT